MRPLSARTFLIGTALVGAALLAVAGVRYARRSYERARELSGANDAAFRLLSSTADDALALAGLNAAGNDAAGHPSGQLVGLSAIGGSPGGVRSRQHVELSLNVALVMVVALLSVALMITVIIIIAVSLDAGYSKSRSFRSDDVERRLCDAAPDRDPDDEDPDNEDQKNLGGSHSHPFLRHDWLEDEESAVPPDSPRLSA